MLELDDTWMGIEGNDNDHPFLVRARENLQNFIGSKLYETRVDICWAFNSSDESLMPDKKDLSLMTKVENALVASLEPDIQSILAFVFTGNNQRVWYWYSKDPVETTRRINISISKFKKLPIEIFSASDPDWQEYQNIID